MAVYQTDDGAWVVSSRRTWITGVYETAKAARLAYRVRPDILHNAWEAKRDQDGVVRSCFSDEEMRQLVAQSRGASL